MTNFEAFSLSHFIKHKLFLFLKSNYFLFSPSYKELPNNDLTLEDTFEVGDDYLEDKLDEGIEDEDEETEEDDKIFGFIPNPLTPVFKLQKDIQSNVDSLLSKIPIIG